MNSKGLLTALASVAAVFCAPQSTRATIYNFDVDSSSGIGAGVFSIELPDAWPGHIGQSTIVPALSFHGARTGGAPWASLAISLNEPLERPNNAVLFGSTADLTEFSVPAGGIGITPGAAVGNLAGVSLRSIGVEVGGGGNVAPTITCPAPVALECTQGGPATVSVEVRDADGDPLEVVWAVDGVIYQTNSVPAATAAPTQATVEFTAHFETGAHDIVVSVSDGNAPPVTCSTTVTVGDTTPPTVQGAWANPAMLWPPDNRLVPVRLQVQATDNCSAVTWKILSVRCNEPIRGGNDSKKSTEWIITGDTGLRLRATRLGNGTGRVYTITIESRDAAGNKATKDVTVGVPHDQKKNGPGAGGVPHK